MKKHLVLLLALALFVSLFSAAAAKDEPAIYLGQARLDVRILAKPDKNAASLGIVAKNRTMEILEVEPTWAKIRYNGITGYVRRSSIIDTSVNAVNPVTTPPYSTVECDWLAWVAGDVPILTAPQADAEVLITMHDGARLALIDIEDGWGRLIYHRQYAYINTNGLSEIQPINKTSTAGSDAPLAAYTSFYRITTDESNINRMLNLQVACDRFTLYTLSQGDRLDFNKHIGPYSRSVGYQPANALVKGEVVQSYGGGTCQVSSTLYNVLLQLPGLQILHRRAHGPSAASYLPHGADAAVGNKTQNLIFKSLYDFPVRIDGTSQDGALTIAIYRAD
ncbi:MAG: SH3 domain-containing protein [Clostridiales bacterium]|nr:SH3 domain-containing protein [Clostridiales bacterium]